MTNEEIITRFLRRPEEGGAYTDERLAMLLAHAQDGKLAFYSCCCLIGIPTADHPLCSEMEKPYHSIAARRTLPNAEAAEGAFARLGVDARAADQSDEADDQRARTKLIPLIEAEMERRQRLNEPTREYGDPSPTNFQNVLSSESE